MNFFISKNFAVILFCLSVLSGLFWNHKVLTQSISSDEIQYNAVAIRMLKYIKPTINVEGLGNLKSQNYSINYNEKSLSAIEPFYSVFLSGVYFLFGAENFKAVKIIQIFIFAFIILIAYQLAKKMANDKIAKISGLFTILFFPLAGAAGYLLRETLFTFLIITLIYFLYQAQETLKNKWFIISGINLGLAVLTNAILQFFIIFIPFYFIIAFLKKRNIIWKSLIFKLILLTLFFFAITGSWSLRSLLNGDGAKSLNFKSGGTLSRKVEMMENIKDEKYLRHLGGQLFGYYFFEKNGFEPSEFLGARKTDKKIREMIEKGYNFEKIDNVLMKDNINAVFNDMPQYFAISILDFLQFNGPMLFNPTNLQSAPMQNLFIKNSYPKVPIFFKITILLCLRIIYWLFFGFIIYGLLKTVRNWQKFGWIILIILYFNLAYSAVFGLSRYAIPIYPFYIILFALGLDSFQNNSNLFFAARKNPEN